MQIEVTKIFTFDAAHRLLDYKGKCHEMHGHTYKLELTARGKRDPRGIVVDFGDLKQVYKAYFEDKLDHRYLNDTLGLRNTTAENVVCWLFNYWEEQVRPDFPAIELQRVVLWETPTSFASLCRQDWEEGRRADL